MRTGLSRCDWMITFDGRFPEADGLRIFRREHLADKSFTIPWDLPGQDALPLEAPPDGTPPDNVVQLRQAES